MDSTSGMSTGFVTLTPVKFADLPQPRPGMIACIVRQLRETQEEDRAKPQ